MKFATKKLSFLVAALFLCAVIFFVGKLWTTKDISLINPSASQQQLEKSKHLEQLEHKKIFVSAWIPYWAKTDGTESLKENLDIFSELHPFAFGVDANGNLTDVLKINNEPWPQLINQSKSKNIGIIPTILWGDAKAMHAIFSDDHLRQKHIDSISKMLDQGNFSGVDIDYEGKDIADKDAFSNFIIALSENLLAKQKTLNCTIEARTQDNPPEGFSGTRAMSWANDFSVLSKNCESVTIMAYDQVFQQHRANTFRDESDSPMAPNAANDWVEENIKYALRYIPAEKLMLGIPTYGWEFAWKKIDNGYSYERIKSISYFSAIQEAKNAGVSPKRNAQGELSFVWASGNENRLVTFEDAQSIKDKIAISKKYALKGFTLFKIDGLSDPDMFSTIAKETAFN